MKKLVIILMLFCSCSLQAQVFNDFFIGKSLSIGRGGNYSPNNALLVVGDDNATKAMIIPRVSNRNVVVLPVYGMLVYDKSTSSIWYRDHSDWKELGASADDWRISGNAGTTANHFIGTVDAIPLRFRVNNQERMILTETGLGINVSETYGALDLKGMIMVRDMSEEPVGNFTSIYTLDHVSYFYGASNIELQAGGETRMRINGANGKIAVGNIIAENTLDVDGIIQSRQSFLLHNPVASLRADWAQSGSVAMLRTLTAHPISFGINSNEKMRLTSNGLGIGTSSPLYPLTIINPGTQIHISDNTQDKGGYLFSRGVINTTVVLSQDVSLEGGQQISKANYAGLLTLSGGSLQFFGGTDQSPGTTFTGLQRIKVDAASGNFMIGIGSASNQRKLQVNGDAAITGSAGIASNLMGRNNTGDIAAITTGQGLILDNNILTASDGAYGFTSAMLTANNTITTAHTITIEDNSAGKVTVTFTGFDKINNQYVILKRSVAYKKNNGVLSLSTVRSLETDEIDGLTTASATIDASSGNIRCRVTGETGKSINWSLYIKSEKNIPPN